MNADILYGIVNCLGYTVSAVIKEKVKRKIVCHMERFHASWQFLSRSLRETLLNAFTFKGWLTCLLCQPNPWLAPLFHSFLSFFIFFPESHLGRFRKPRVGALPPHRFTSRALGFFSPRKYTCPKFWWIGGGIVACVRCWIAQGAPLPAKCPRRNQLLSKLVSDRSFIK